MGRYLEAFKGEFKKSLPAVVRPSERQEPPVQPYYDDRRPVQSYDQGPPGEMTRADFQAALEQARRQEREDTMARLDAAHHAHADRLTQVALAAVNKQNTPVEIRYRGSAYDKKERRFGELKFALLAGLVVLLLIFVFWVKDQLSSYADSSPPAWGQAAHSPPAQHKHYKRTEEYDDR